ncbi:hypothetical protein JCM10213v2_008981 [Rhodosporidiobolus nylandii]
MSCCCSTPSSAVLGASIFSLVICVPVAFYTVVELIWHSKEVDSLGREIVLLCTAVAGTLAAMVALCGRGFRKSGVLQVASVVGALAFVLASVTMVWSCIVQGQVVIACLIFWLTPQAFLAYEAHAYARQLSGQKPLLPVARKDPTLPDSTTAGTAAGEKDGEQVSLSSLARHLPFGRSPRGRDRRGTYAAPSKGSRGQVEEHDEDAWRSGVSGSEEGGFGSSEEEEMLARQQRKQRSRQGKY